MLDFLKYAIAIEVNFSSQIFFNFKKYRKKYELIRKPSTFRALPTDFRE